MLTIVTMLQVLIDAVCFVVVVQVILSLLVSFNVINTYNETVRTIYTGLNRGTEPLYRPIRRILPDFGAIDLAPFAFLVLMKLLSIGLNGLVGA